jgi:amino acid transporter
VLLSLVLPIIIALINIGSTEALYIILSIYNSALIASYLITIGCILLHRLRGGKLPHARYSLGKWGIVVNSIALIYITPIFIFSFFPAFPNPTPAAMNWAIAMVGGIVVLATVYYMVWARKIYSPPNDTVEDYIERYETTLSSSEKASGVVADTTESVHAGKRDM